jgi:hypothetical protein
MIKNNGYMKEIIGFKDFHIGKGNFIDFNMHFSSNLLEVERRNA